MRVWDRICKDSGSFWESIHKDLQRLARLWERICKDLVDFGRVFGRIGKTLG